MARTIIKLFGQTTLIQEGQPDIIQPAPIINADEVKTKKIISTEGMIDFVESKNVGGQIVETKLMTISTPGSVKTGKSKSQQTAEAAGMILVSENGTRFKLEVSNNGIVVVTNLG